MFARAFPAIPVRRSFSSPRISVFGAFLALLLAFDCSPASAVAQWARLYSMPCADCHAPYPRLNAVGFAFKQNGYRFTLNEPARIDRKNLVNYIGTTWAPTASTGERERGTASGNTLKIHLGGPVGRVYGFLIQPTPGGEADFNMVQGVAAYGSKRDSFRVVGGRIFAWANGGGVGAADRCVTATVPRMLSALHGVTPGGLGNGARLEFTHDERTILSAFTSDMEATGAPSQVFGLSLARRLDAKTASAVELFAAQGEIPVKDKPDISGWRYGIFADRAFTDKKGREPFNLLSGVLYGSDSRPLEAYLPTHFWTGFVELDWTPSNRVTWIARQEWETGTVSRGANTASTLGAALEISKNLRFDTDLLLHTPASSSPRLLFRFRLVY